MKRNAGIASLSTHYLFREINSRKREFLKNHPQAELIHLGIGDTTQPIPASVAKELTHAARKLGTVRGYTGYGPEQGLKELREAIAKQFYNNTIKPEEIFISDGAKCDIGRLQMLFGPDVSIAVQDPAYPVYIDGSKIQGVTEIHYMACNPKNHFFPDLKKLPRTDLIYFCSPNNPTGAVATKEQLERLVQFAQKNRSIILFDAAYACYIQDSTLPKSIFEIEGAQSVAIEVNSFSKIAGFTGVRLGWTVVPEELKYDDGHSVRSDWSRLMSTVFNGASNITQAGGLAILREEGINEIIHLNNYYMENAAILKNALQNVGYKVFGGENAPYLWTEFPGQKSWEVFQYLLERYHLVTTPGSGFGPEGEGFIRFTAFGTRNAILDAAKRISSIH
ncbi:MAG: LL-diaminopimelate aminotransferase [Parachlamydiales bacterium]|jgi:LL-diaminopimelate aminotransferase